MYSQQMRDTRVDLTLAPAGGRAPFLTYEPYYALKEKPFSLSADPRFLYKSRTHAPTFDELRAGIRRREGIIVLTGEPGTGKTTLCRSVLEALDRKTFCTFVPDPFVSREDLLKMLLVDFGVMSIDDLKNGRMNGTSRPELSYPLYDFLRSLVPLQSYAVLIIDEAQNLTSQLLEEIRILSDLEGPEKLLQLVLVGQPELRTKLKDPSMRQVDQRISVRCSLQPLERDAVSGYLAHRLTVAGGGSDRVDFSPDAIDVLYRASNGNPRVINLIADKSLHRGHIERTWLITPEIVTAALADLGFAKPVLSLDLSFPVTLAPPTPLLTYTPDEGPQLLMQDRPALGTSVTSHERRGRRRVRRAALLASMVLVLATTGVLLNQWDLQRQELTQPLTLPALPTAPVQPIRAGANPVIPPPEFFAPVVP
jgi:general secretion pathway protein A